MKVNIYLSYYNGSEYIDAQIASLLNQRNVDVHIYIRDDGSNEIEAAYIDKYCDNKKITVIHSENLGYRKSFIWLASKITEKADFYAFCDQDDVWLNNKLEIACERLENYTEPAAYSALPQYVDSKLSPIEGCFSMIDNLHFGEMSIDDALGYHFFGLGCTFVWNNSFNDLLHSINLDTYCFGHDNFFSVLAPFVGTFYRDNSQVILYRQHERNTSGSKNRQGLYKRIKSVLKIYKSQGNYLLRKYILDEFGCCLPSDKLELLKMSVYYRSNILNKIKLMRRELKRADRNRRIKNIFRILSNRF